MNPYEAPRATLGGPARFAVVPLQQSRWALLRFLLVAYFALWTLVLPLGSVYGAVMVIRMLATATDPAVLSSRRFVDAALIVPAYAMMAPLAFFATRAWYRCRWWRAVLLSTGFGGLVALGGLISKLR